MGELQGALSVTKYTPYSNTLVTRVTRVKTRENRRKLTSANTFWTMAWRIVCELLLLSKFVSLSVIPENRKLNELSLVPEEIKSQRTKRSIDSFYSDDDDDDDVETVEHWDSLC